VGFFFSRRVMPKLFHSSRGTTVWFESVIDEVI
jgi:hypothetical protein